MLKLNGPGFPPEQTVWFTPTTPGKMLLILTVTVNGALGHVGPAFAITLYKTLVGVVSVVDKEPVMLVPVPETSPATFGLFTGVHVKTVPAGKIVVGGALIGVTLNVPLLQIVAVWFGMTMPGTTVTVS